MAERGADSDRGAAGPAEGGRPGDLQSNAGPAPIAPTLRSEGNPELELAARQLEAEATATRTLNTEVATAEAARLEPAARAVSKIPPPRPGVVTRSVPPNRIAAVDSPAEKPAERSPDKENESAPLRRPPLPPRPRRDDEVSGPSKPSDEGAGNSSAAAVDVAPGATRELDDDGLVEHEVDLDDELTTEEPLVAGEDELLESEEDLLEAEAEEERAQAQAAAKGQAAATPEEELSDDDIEEELDDSALEELKPDSPPGIPALRGELPRTEVPVPADADVGGMRGGTKRRVRNTLRIPDDAVPATPAPPIARPVDALAKPEAAAHARVATEAQSNDDPVAEFVATPAPVATLPPPARVAAGVPRVAALSPNVPAVGAPSDSATDGAAQRTRSGTLVMKPAPADRAALLDAVAAADRADGATAEEPVRKTDGAPPAARRDDEPPAPTRADEPAAKANDESPAAAAAAAPPQPAQEEPAEPDADTIESTAKTLPGAPPPDPPTLPIGTKVPRVRDASLSDDGPPVIEPIVPKAAIPRPVDSTERLARSRRPISPPTEDAPGSQRAPASARPSAPSGVVTDQQSVGLILPVFVSSDLPPVESQRGRKVAPPRRLSREDEAFDGIEEIEPEAEITVPDGKVPKGPPAADTPSPPPGELAGAAGRRAPPPRRPRDAESGIEVDLDLDEEAIDAAPTPRPPAIATPAAVPPPPPVPPAPVFEAPAPTPEAPPAAASAPGGAQADAEAATPAAEGKPSGTPAPKAPKRKKPWWSELFEEDYAKTIDTPTEKDVAREADFIERVLNLAKGARVLDLGCGLGRHAVELASRGYEMVGVDHSTLMLAKANEHAAERGLGVNFVKGDMRKLSLDAVFDGIYCWSQTFGYFDEQTNHAVLESIHRALRQGGTFALDVANRDFVAPRSPTMVWFERPGCVCMDEMKFDFYTSRMIVKRTVLFETGRSREIEYSMRMYSLHELGRMLHGCGFRVLEVSGHRAHPGTYFGSESPRIIVAAERV